MYPSTHNFAITRSSANGSTSNSEWVDWAYFIWKRSIVAWWEQIYQWPWPQQFCSKRLFMLWSLRFVQTTKERLISRCTIWTHIFTVEKSTWTSLFATRWADLSFLRQCMFCQLMFSLKRGTDKISSSREKTEGQQKTSNSYRSRVVGTRLRSKWITDVLHHKAVWHIVIDSCKVPLQNVCVQPALQPSFPEACVVPDNLRVFETFSFTLFTYLQIHPSISVIWFSKNFDRTCQFW